MNIRGLFGCYMYILYSTGASKRCACTSSLACGFFQSLLEEDPSLLPLHPQTECDSHAHECTNHPEEFRCFNLQRMNHSPLQHFTRENNHLFHWFRIVNDVAAEKLLACGSQRLCDEASENRRVEHNGVRYGKRALSAATISVPEETKKQTKARKITCCLSAPPCTRRRDWPARRGPGAPFAQTVRKWVRHKEKRQMYRSTKVRERGNL